MNVLFNLKSKHLSKCLNFRYWVFMVYKMGKIGILTYHNNINRGSILQAFSLYNFLQKNSLKREIEIVDYRLFSEEIKRICSRNPLTSVYKTLDYFTFENFFRSNDALSKEKIITNNHNKAIKFLKNKNYDMLIVGSDTVWRLENGKLARPFPNAYFLDPDLDCLKVSYAASSSITDYKNLSKDKINSLNNHFNAFEKISVRDEHTENFLKKLGINDFRRVPDPTILEDLPKKDLTNVLENNNIDLSRPIIAINQCRNFSKDISKYYKDRGYQIVSLYKSKYADFNLLGKITPLEYYSIYRHFDFVISGSLHSTIFSIKNKIPFATLDFSTSDFIDKKENLLKEFSLLDRQIKVANKSTNEVFDKINSCEKKLNKRQIQKKLTSMKKLGIEYVNDLLTMLD